MKNKKLTIIKILFLSFVVSCQQSPQVLGLGLVKDCGITFQATCPSTDLVLNSCLTTAGDLLAVQCSRLAVVGSNIITSVTDNFMDTWKGPFNCEAGNNWGSSISVSNGTNGGNTVVTVHVTAGSSSQCYMACDLAEFQPQIIPNNPVSACGNNISTTMASGNVSPTNPANFYEFGVGYNKAAQSHLTGPTSPLTELSDDINGAFGGNSTFSSWGVNSPGTFGNTWTITTNAQFASQVLALAQVETPTPTATATPTIIPTASPTPKPTGTATITGPTPSPRPTVKYSTSMFGNAIAQGYFQWLPHHLNEAPAAPINGQSFYCDDCTAMAPCTGGGLGALAIYLNNNWSCSSNASSPLNAQGDLVLNSTDGLSIQDLSHRGVFWVIQPFGAGTRPYVYLQSNPTNLNDATQGDELVLAVINNAGTIKTGIACDTSDITGAGKHANACYPSVPSTAIIDRLPTTVSILNATIVCNATNEGARAAVTDATAATAVFGTVLVGGSTVHTGAYCNGTNWIAQ